MAEMKPTNKKGVLFTIGLALLMSTILTLAILIFNTAQKSEEIVTKLAVIDRVYELDNSMQESLSDIFELKSGILVNMTKTSISFIEELPNTHSSQFNSSMNSFKRFVEHNFSNVNITTDDVASRLPLAIMPYGITYEHVNFGNKKIRVTPAAINFNGYSVYMTVNENISSCNWNTKPGSFNFSAEVRGSAGSCVNSILISPSHENYLRINGEDINITVHNNILSVSIDEESGIEADIKTTIKADAYNAYVVYPVDVIKINFSELGVHKEGGVRLA